MFSRLPLLLLLLIAPCWGNQQPQQPLADFLLDFLERKQPTSTVLYYSQGRDTEVPGGRLSWLDPGLLSRLQRTLGCYVTVVPLPAPARLQRTLTTVAHQSTSHVILSDDNASVQFLSTMRSRCMWLQGGSCLIFSRGSAATDKLTSSFVPVDNEVLVAEVTQRPDGVTSIDLVEVFHLGESRRRTVLASWHSDTGMASWDERSFFVRRGDWQGLHLNVVSIQENPYTELVGTDNPAISGLFGDIWSHLAAALNFTYSVRRSVDDQFGMLQPSGRWTGMVGMLDRREADVAVAAIGVSRQRDGYIDFTRPVVQHWQHVFLTKPTASDPVSGAFLFVFHWTLLLALAVCAALVWWAMAAMYWLERRLGLAALQQGNYGSGDCLMMALCALFQQGPDYDPEGLGSRFLLWTLFVAMFMINASYSAVLTSYLTVKNDDVAIHNFKELLQDGTFTLGVPNNTVFLEDFKSAKKETLQQIYERHVEVMADEESTLARVQTDQKFAYLNLYTGTEDCHLVSFRAEEFSPQLAIAMQDNSPYREFFNYHLSRLDEGGILDRLDRHWTYAPSDQCIDSNVVEVSMPAVFTAFTALGVGVAASVALLAAELFWFRRKRDRAHARELLRRWAGGGELAAAPTAAMNPWKPAQAAAKFKAKEHTAKTGLFLKRVQRLQEPIQRSAKQKLAIADRSPTEQPDSPTEQNLLLEDCEMIADVLTGSKRTNQ